MAESEIEKIFNAMQQQCNTQLHIPIDDRIKVLLSLKKLLQSKADEIAAAIDKDFIGRCYYETSLLEIYPLIQTISYCVKNIKKWSKPRKKHISWLLKPAKAKLFPQAVGVVGIMVPWNYPLYLSLAPAVYAIAAGNRIMIKLSELTPTFGALMAKLLQVLNTENNTLICIINGDVRVSQQFSQLPFGHLLFTGSSKVGKKVMEAASQNLTPVTLELGGKSPVIVSDSFKDTHMERLLMGKCFNAGQTCIAPDYILVEKKVEPTLKAALIKAFKKCYPDGALAKNFTSIISDSEFERLDALLQDAKVKGAEIVFPSSEAPNAKTKKFPLCLMFNVSVEMDIMKEEIFGPILPIMHYSRFEEAVSFINSKPHPLALYYFGNNKKQIKQLHVSTHSGALTINDTLMHIAVDDLPFGGVGNSGMGCYHGQEGFDTFSHLKPTFYQGFFSGFSYLYPPYGRLARFFVRWVSGIKITFNK